VLIRRRGRPSTPRAAVTAPVGESIRSSLDREEIEARLDAIEVQIKDSVSRDELRQALGGILDLERLLSRVTLETANPRDLLALAASLAKIPETRKLLAGLSAARLRSPCG